MQTFSQTFVGAQTWQLNVVGSYFTVLECTNALTVRLFKGGQLLDLGTINNVLAGIEIMPKGRNGEAAFDRVEVDINGDTVKVGIGNGEARYSRMSGVVTVSNLNKGTAFSELAPVTVGVAAGVVAAAAAARKGVRIYNGGTAPIYLGSSAVTVANSPVMVQPGQMWLEDDAPSAAIYGISGTAGQVVRVQEVI